MKTRTVLQYILLAAVLTAGKAAGQVVADHRAVAAFDSIPAEWIDSVKCMLLVLPGESHGRGYHYGMDLLEADDATYASNVTWSGTPETYTASYLRTSRSYRFGGSWSTSCGEEDFYTNGTARGNIGTGLTYTRSNYSGRIAFGFGWCWDMTWHNGVGGTEDTEFGCRWAGSSVDGPDGDVRWGLDAGDSVLTGNSVCMQTYLDAVDAYNTTESGITTFFTTGPVDGSHATEGGYQRWVKHEFIRDYVAAHGGYLFDYADILCWEDGVQYMDSWDGHDFQNGDTDLASGGTGYDGGDGGCHISEDGCLALGKAMWWFLARVAGWDGTTGPDTVVNTPVISPDGGSYEEEVTVSISTTTDSAAVYYTTDGSVPDSTDTEYAAAFVLTADAVVQAVAYKAGLFPSAVETAVFVVTRDTVGPAVTNAYARTATAVVVVYDSEVDSATAVDDLNYAVDNGISVTGVVLGTGATSVVLTVSPALSDGESYTVTVSDVEDRYGNTVAPGTQEGFSFNTCAAHLSFDEGSGDTAYDGTGNGNNGGVNTAAWTADAMSGYALRFDGDDTLDIGTGTFGIDTTNAFTVSLWCKRSGSFSGYLIQRGQYYFPFMIIASGNNPRFCVRTDGTNYITSANAFDDGTWYHVALTYEDGARVFYVDGAVDTAAALGGTLNMNGAQWTRIGHGFSGVIDEVKIFDRALSQAEVQVLYEDMVPVELSSFTAERVDGDVRLAWTTESERMNLGWDVYRSVDGGPFTAVNDAMVPGRGTTALPGAYSYLDDAVPAAAGELAYYLRQYDTDGGGSCSPTVRVDMGVSGIGPVAVDAVRPVGGNPVGDEVVFAVPAGTVLRVYDRAGVLVGTGTADAVGFRWNAAAAAPGVYYYEFITDGRVRTGRLVKTGQ